jgi:glutamate/aspartate transport system ATP-binding protein
MVFQQFELFPHLKVAHRVVYLDQGAIVEDVTKDEFFEKPKSDRAKEFLAKILH